MQAAEGEAENEGREQGQDRPGDGPLHAVAKRVHRQRKYDQALVQAPLPADLRAAPEQLRAQGERGERDHQSQVGLRQPSQRSSAASAPRACQRERGREAARSSEQAHEAWSRSGRVRRRGGMAARDGSTLWDGVQTPLPLRPHRGRVEPERASQNLRAALSSSRRDPRARGARTCATWWVDRAIDPAARQGQGRTTMASKASFCRRGVAAAPGEPDARGHRLEARLVRAVVMKLRHEREPQRLRRLLPG